jgi:plastocyanin
MKKLLALLATGATAAVLAAPAAAATKTVTVGDDYFVRKGATPTVVIKSGDMVKWVWTGKHKHQVFQVGGPTDGKHLHSPAQTKGTWKHLFRKRGLYEFQCPYHAGQKMNVRVK